MNTQQSVETYPLVLIVGLDPTKHKIPPLLMHYLKKMQKDFVIRFIDGEDFTPESVPHLKKVLKGINFKPTKKKKLI